MVLDTRQASPDQSGPVHDGHQAQKPPSHGQVGDVSGPDLVYPVDLQSLQEVGVHLMVRCRLAGVGPPVDGLQPHYLHQALDPLAVDLVPLGPQPDRNLLDP
jgi:hypothetical protein